MPRRPASRGAIDLVEALYQEPPAQWMPRLVAELRQLVPGSLSSVGYAYDLSGRPEGWRISYPVADGGPPSLAEEVHRSFEQAPPDFRRALFSRMKPAATYSETMGTLLTEQHEEGAAAAKRLESFDALYVNAVDPEGQGVLVAVNLAARTRLVPAQRARFSMIAAHMAAARRLLAAGSVEKDRPEVVFETSGKVAHVTRGHEGALGALRERVVRLDRARRAADPDEALACWKALVSGKYSVIGRIDSDGRRYIVAHENAPGIRDPRGLSPAEAAIAGWAARGLSQKLIAYQLGVSAGTVGGQLARIYQKLGVSTNAELIERLAPRERLTRLTVGRDELLIFSGPRSLVPRKELAQLTPAELALVEDLLRGATNAEIARKLGKSANTVAHQVSAIFRRFGVSSRAELVARWTRATAPPSLDAQ